MNKKIIIAVVILVVAFLGYWFMDSRSAVVVSPTADVAAVGAAIIE